MFGYTGISWRKMTLAVAVVAAVVLGAIAVLHGPALYRNWRLSLLQRQAAGLAANKEWRKAAMAIRQAIALDAANPETIRLWIGLIDPLNSPDELYWRCTLADLAPGDHANLVEIARMALPLGRPLVGRRALGALRETMDGRAEYHNLLSAYALRAGNPQDALREASAAVALDPGAPALKFNLAQICAASSDAVTRARAWSLLEQLRATPAHARRASRIMRDLARSESGPDRALGFSETLLAAENPALGDRFIHIDLLSDAGRKDDAEHALARLKTECAAHPATIAPLAGWMLARKREADLLAWIGSLPPQTLERPETRKAIAGVLVTLERWSDILKRFSDHRWEKDDHIRESALARAHRETAPFGDTRWQTHWGAAMDDALRDARSAVQLARLAAAWPGWDEPCADLLWRIDETYPAGGGWALDELRRLYERAGNTDGLLRVHARLLEVAPRNDELKNNWAYYSLLLERDVARASDLADQLHREHPGDPVAASTHALALYRAGRGAEALRVLEALKPDALDRPAIAALHSAALAWTGNVSRARALAGKAARGTLLPQEKELMADVLTQTDKETPGAAPAPGAAP